MLISLNDCVLNREYIINYVDDKSSISNRFNDIGIVPGNSIKKVLNSPFGGICAYDVMGSIIGIRDRDASLVRVSYE